MHVAATCTHQKTSQVAEPLPHSDIAVGCPQRGFLRPYLSQKSRWTRLHPCTLLRKGASLVLMDRCRYSHRMRAHPLAEGICVGGPDLEGICVFRNHLPPNQLMVMVMVMGDLMWATVPAVHAGLWVPCVGRWSSPEGSYWIVVLSHNRPHRQWPPVQIHTICQLCAAVSCKRQTIKKHKTLRLANWLIFVSRKRTRWHNSSTMRWLWSWSFRSVFSLCNFEPISAMAASNC